MTASMIRILAVDDEQLLLWALQRACKNRKLEITTASTTEEALEKLDHCHYDIFLLDFDLRDPGRVQLLKELDERCPFIPIIIMTTSSVNSIELNDTIRSNRKSGAWHLIEKPFKLDRLVGFIELIFLERDNVKLCINNLTHNYDSEKRIRLRYPHVQTVNISYKSIVDGVQNEISSTGILTDVSDSGLGLLTKAPLNPDQVINFGDDLQQRCGIVAWSKKIEPDTYRSGIVLC